MAPARDWLIADCENPPAEGIARKNAVRLDAGESVGDELLVVVDVGLVGAAQLTGDGDRLEEAHDRDPAKAPGSSLSTRSNDGHTGMGSPEGTSAISAKPCSSISVSATRRIPPITATSGPGIVGARGGSSSTAIVPAENAMVTTLMSSSWSNTTRMSSTKLSAVGSPGVPSSLGELAGRHRQPDTELDAGEGRLGDVVDDVAEPEEPGGEQDHPDEQCEHGQIADGIRAFGREPAAIRLDPVRTATVDVVLTERVRDPPRRAYTAIGTMHVRYSPT